MGGTADHGGMVWEFNSRSKCASRPSWLRLHCTGISSGTISASIMPVYIVEHFHQLNAIIKDLTQDFMRQIKVHVCKLRHRDVMCSSFAQMMHDGTNAMLSLVYISHDLQRGAEIIVKELMHHFPDGYDNDDEHFILTCPGCGLTFSQQ